MSKTYGKYNLTSEQILDILKSIELKDTPVSGGEYGIQIEYEGHSFTVRAPFQFRS